MPIIEFVREEKRIEVPSGSVLRDICKEHGIQIYPWHSRVANCRGLGLCGTCLVQVDDGTALSERSEAEVGKLGSACPDTYRLACQAQVQADFRCLTQVELPHGWHDHPAHSWMRNPDPFAGRPTLSSELQAERQGEAVQALESEG